MGINFKQTHLNENNIINDISKTIFFEWLNKEGLSETNIKEMFDGKKITSLEQQKLNSLLKKAKTELFITVVESLIYFDENFIDIKKIIPVLDGETRFIVKKELAEKYKLELEITNLSEIIE